MRIRALIFCLAVLGGVNTAAAREAIDRPFFLLKSVSLAKIESVDEDGRINVGTAVTVAPGKLVTNCHVTRRGVRVRVVKGGGQYTVTTQYADERRDVCILTAPSWKQPAIELSPSRGTIDQTVVALGFVGGLELSLREGDLLHFHPYDTSDVIQTNTPFTSGASGGALFNLKAELLGMLTFRLRGGNSHYFAVPVAWIREALVADATQAQAVAPLSGLPTFWEQPPQTMPYFLRVFQQRNAQEWGDQETTASEWVDAEPKNELAWLALGEAQTMRGRASVALHALRRAAGLAPDGVAVHHMLALALIEVGDFLDAKRAVDVVRKHDGVLARSLDETLSLKTK